MDSYTFPRLDQLLPHQIEVLRDPHRFKTFVWHRRARKTSTAIEKLLLEAHNPYAKNKVYWHVFPTFAEAKEAIWKDPAMMGKLIPNELIEKTNESELTVYFKSGSILSLKGADKPERLLGAGPAGVILDEFAEMKPEVWTRIIQPILRANGGWCWFIGTPKGKNHLFELYMKGQVDSTEWKSWLLKASTSGVLSPEQLDFARKDMPYSLFQQEFECDFLEGEGTVFRGVREMMTAEPQKPLANHLYVMGVDLGKVQDYTVITVYDRKTNKQVYYDRFQAMEWPFQKAKIRQICEHYNRALVVIDSTGLGEPIADDLSRAGVPIEPMKFTNESKKEMIEKLSIWIELGRIRLIPNEETRYEFDNFNYEIGQGGRIRYQAREGFHDDIVWSHALAVWSLSTLSKNTNAASNLIQNTFNQRLQEMSSGYQEEQQWSEWNNDY